MKRGFIPTALAAAILIVWASGHGAARQASNDDQQALRTRIEQRYDIVPLSGGVALTPKSPRGDVRLIEISDTIAINGVQVSGRELRERLGADADTGTAALVPQSRRPAPAVCPPGASGRTASSAGRPGRTHDARGSPGPNHAGAARQAIPPFERRPGASIRRRGCQRGRGGDRKWWPFSAPSASTARSAIGADGDARGGYATARPAAGARARGRDATSGVWRPGDADDARARATKPRTCGWRRRRGADRGSRAGGGEGGGRGAGRRGARNRGARPEGGGSRRRGDGRRPIAPGRGRAR